MTNPPPKPSQDIAALIEIMRRLRDPQTGCPWDVKQNFATIAPYTIEEAYEVAAAIEDGDLPALKEELGDLLLQVVFHARMAEEQGAFAFGDVVQAVTTKLIDRHPHVFGDVAAANADAVVTNWDAIKKRERAAKAKHGVLDDVPAALPALLRAEKLQKRASSVGFDWNNPNAVVDKIAEEAREIADAQAAGADKAAIADEIGDLLFAAVNLARHFKVDPEDALRGTNAKFIRRFRFIEAELGKRGVQPEDASLDEMEALWNAAKQIEKGQA
jgi:MazG family protein